MAYKSKAQEELEAAKAEVARLLAENEAMARELGELEERLLHVNTEVEDTLDERNSKYGGSYYQTDLAIQAMTGGNAANLQGLLETGQLANWVMIISKANRAVNSPTLDDHMRDIAGYARLNLRIQRGQTGN